MRLSSSANITHVIPASHVIPPSHVIPAAHVIPPSHVIPAKAGISCGIPMNMRPQTPASAGVTSKKTDRGDE